MRVIPGTSTRPAVPRNALGGTMTVVALTQLPDWLWDVPYNGSSFPGEVPRSSMREGANCQLFAYAVLAMHGFDLPDLMSSELWADDEYTLAVPNPQPLDLVLFSADGTVHGAHVGVVVGVDEVLHLCKEVGRPVVWPWSAFAARPRYEVVIGYKRPFLVTPFATPSADLEVSSAAVILTRRLVLTPLRVEDAEEMVSVFEDERLHEFTGGHPLTFSQLRDRYGDLVAGARDPSQEWLNWIVRQRAEAIAVGTVQATVSSGANLRADVAWVIGVPWQGHGYATEAASAMVTWLRGLGVERISANIHPDHRASIGVATRLGLAPTDDWCDGEKVWQLPAGRLS